MLKDMYRIEKISITQKVNGCIYYAKMIPLLGKYIKDIWYQSPRIKKILSILIFLSSILMGIVLKVIYFGVMICLPLVLKFGTSSLQMFGGGILYLFLILNCITGPLLLNTTTNPQKKEYVLISLMHMSAKRYVYAKWCIEFLLPTIYVWVMLMLLMNFVNLPIWYAFLASLCYSSSHFLGEAFHIHCFGYRKKTLASDPLYVFPIFLLLYGIAYVPVVLGSSMLSHHSLWMICMGIYSMIAACIAYAYLRKVDFTSILRKGIHANRDIYNGVLLKESKTADAKLQDKDYTQQELQDQRFSDKQGYEYLNALFFQRHKRLFYRPMRNRILGILIFFLLLDAGILILGEEFMTLRTPLHALPVFVFALYFVSIGERVTRVMFYNCDSSLLHYGYYKEPKAILTNFRIRLRKIIQMNTILAFLISVGFLSFLICSRTTYDMIDIVIFIISIFSLSTFFSIHHLFLYYVLQPYAGTLEMKSPIFVIVNSAVYLVCYMAMKLEGNMLFALSILGATVGYCCLALFLVYLFAPKKFHIR